MFSVKRGILVFGDSSKENEKIVRLLKQEFDANIYFANNNHDAYGYLCENYMDAVIIDIDNASTEELMSGFEFAYSIRYDYKFYRKPLIFVSGHEEYKAPAYEKFQCIKVLDTPIDSMELYNAVEIAFSMTEMPTRKVFRTVKTEEGIECIYVDEIVYIDVENKSIVFHMTDNEMITSKYYTLERAECDLRRHGFIRTSREFLLNAQYAKVVDYSNKEIKLKYGFGEVPIGRRYQKVIREYFLRYHISKI